MEQENCRCFAQLLLAAGETFTLPRHIEQLVGLLYLRSGSGILLEQAYGSVIVEGKSAVLYPGWEPLQISVCEDSSLLISAFRCSQPEEMLAGWNEANGPVQDCRSLPEAQRLLPQLDSFSPGLELAPGIQLATRLLQILLGRSGGTDAPAYLQAVRHMIETRYAENITLDMLAVQVGRSKFHLSRSFREYFHMSPNAYLTAVRLSQAAELLTGTELPVREIGKRVGFDNNAYFTARFKEKYSHPPREYRLMNRAVESKQPAGSSVSVK